MRLLFTWLLNKAKSPGWWELRSVDADGNETHGVFTLDVVQLQINRKLREVNDETDGE